MISCGAVLSREKLIWGHSGNISLKIDEQRFIISASGTNLGDLKEDEIITCRINGDDTVTGGKRPSMETGMHRAVYAVCPDAGAVIHSQPFYSTLVACSGLKLRTDILPEAMAYLGNIERVAYYHAGSKALADAIAEKAPSAGVIIMENHGVVCWGDSLEDTLLKTQTLEFLCKMVVTAHSGNIGLKNLGVNVMDDFLNHLKNMQSGEM